MNPRGAGDGFWPPGSPTRDKVVRLRPACGEEVVRSPEEEEERPDRRLPVPAGQLGTMFLQPACPVADGVRIAQRVVGDLMDVEPGAREDTDQPREVDVRDRPGPEMLAEERAHLE